MAEAKVIYLPRSDRPKKAPTVERLGRTKIRRTLSFLRRMIPIPGHLADRTGPLLVTVSRLLKAAKYEETLALARESLGRCGPGEDAKLRSRWWQFLSCAVYSAEMLGRTKEREEFISLAEDCPAREKGHNAAYCFSHFSRWKYAEKDYARAMAYAEMACEADSTFAEAHFLLGWYALFIRQADPIDHFRSAVKHDPRYLERIIRDPELSNFPHIIANLRRPRLLSRTK
jgi:tetratricopeptide (TPR) repeat protein